jgi:uncharacterized protein YdeI (YjbR/CyaY-like superfamily)
VDPGVDTYIDESELWPDEMRAIRPVLLGAGLDETIKWNKPCYSHDGDNIAILQEMKDFLALMFFKGALLDDPDGVLEEQGRNTRSARRVCFTSVDDVERLASNVTALVEEAIDVEAAGLEVESAPEPELVEELKQRLDRDPELKAAFEALTPGRQRGYSLYFGDAKKSETRNARIDRYAEKILAGKGMHDR